MTEENDTNSKTDDEAVSDTENDVSFEPEDNETHPSSFGRSKDDVLGKLKEKLKETEKKAAEYLDGWQRLKADLVNTRKRDEEGKREVVKYANEALITDLLSVLDSFEMAFSNKEAWEKADKSWRTGVEYIHSQLLGVLGQYGVKTLSPMGETYDPMRDDAVETVPVQDEKDDNKVLEVVRTGYALHGKEIRAPKVKIGHFDKQEGE